MAPVKVNPAKVREFKDAASFYSWLGKHHDKEDEVWIKIHKVGSGLKSITPKKRSTSCFAGAGSTACARARRQELSAALLAARQEKRLEPDQCRQCRAADRRRPDDRARAERRSTRPRPTGAGTRAYKAGKDMKIPADLQAAIDAEPKAKAMLAKLSAQNRFALAFRIHNMKTEAGRKKKIETFVACSSAARRSIRKARSDPCVQGRRLTDRCQMRLAGKSARSASGEPMDKSACDRRVEVEHHDAQLDVAALWIASLRSQ